MNLVLNQRMWVVHKTFWKNYNCCIRATWDPWRHYLRPKNIEIYNEVTGVFDSCWTTLKHSSKHPRTYKKVEMVESSGTGKVNSCNVRDRKTLHTVREVHCLFVYYNCSYFVLVCSTQQLNSCFFKEKCLTLAVLLVVYRMRRYSRSYSFFLCIALDVFRNSIPVNIFPMYRFEW